MPIVSKFNVENADYEIKPVVTSKVEENSEETIKNKAAYKAISESETIIAYAQNKELSMPVDVGGTLETTVEDTLQALAAYRSSVPVPGDTKPLTAGGAYTDKLATAMQGSTANFTAGGAYAYFNGFTTALAWLKSVFGNDYEQKVARGYFVD